MKTVKYENMEGKVFTNTKGCKAEIIQYIDNREVKIRFLDDDKHEMWTKLSSLRNGLFRNPFLRSVKGVGYLGNSPKPVAKEDFKINDIWHNMIDRCYSSKTEGFESYRENGVYVREDWHNFHNFYLWSLPRYIQGYELDKDMFSSEYATMYSEETCVYLPQKLNLALAHMKTDPYINFIKGKFYPRIIIDGISISLGGFSDRNQALNAYKEKKSESVLAILETYRQAVGDVVYERGLQKIDIYLNPKFNAVAQVGLAIEYAVGKGL